MAAHEEMDATPVGVTRVRIVSAPPSKAEIDACFRQLDDAMRRVMNAWRDTRKNASLPANLGTTPEIEQAERTYESLKTRFLTLVGATDEASEGQPRDGEHEEQHGIGHAVGHAHAQDAS